MFLWVPFASVPYRDRVSWKSFYKIRPIFTLSFMFKLPKHLHFLIPWRSRHIVLLKVGLCVKQASTHFLIFFNLTHGFRTSIGVWLNSGIQWVGTMLLQSHICNSCYGFELLLPGCQFFKCAIRGQRDRRDRRRLPGDHSWYNELSQCFPRGHTSRECLLPERWFCSLTFLEQLTGVVIESTGRHFMWLISQGFLSAAINTAHLDDTEITRQRP